MIRKSSFAKGMFSTKISLAKGIQSKTGAAHSHQNFFRVPPGQKVQFKDRNWRHPDADFVILVVGAFLGLPKMGFCYVAKFEPHDFITVLSL